MQTYIGSEARKHSHPYEDADLDGGNGTAASPGRRRSSRSKRASRLLRQQQRYRFRNAGQVGDSVMQVCHSYLDSCREHKATMHSVQGHNTQKIVLEAAIELSKHLQ